MADVKSVDVGGALFVDKCVPSRARTPRSRSFRAAAPRLARSFPDRPALPLGECS